VHLDTATRHQKIFFAGVAEQGTEFLSERARTSARIGTMRFPIRSVH